MPIPPILEAEKTHFQKAKKIWHIIKSSKLFDWFRHSRLNPYHIGLVNIKADNLEIAKQLARQRNEVQFIFNGTRYYAERDCSVNQEYQEEHRVLRGRGDVSDRIPRDKNGNLDLLAEEPIVISIIPIEGPALIGHVSLQYRDRVVNRLITSIHTDPLYPKYQEYSEYYFVYPSQLGIDPKKLIREIDKHNIKYGDKKYNFFTNNCARNVAKVLQRVGIHDFDFLGVDRIGLIFTSPGNNPFNRGIKAWCFKHGVHVHPEEVEKLYNQSEKPDVQARRQEMKGIRDKYRAQIKKQRQR